MNNKYHTWLVVLLWNLDIWPAQQITKCVWYLPPFSLLWLEFIISGSACISLLTFSFFLKCLADTCPFLGPLVPLFWISGDVFSVFQSQSGFYFIHIAEVNIICVPWDPPLVLHIADLLMISIVGRRPGSYLAQGYYQQWLQPDSNQDCWVLSHTRCQLSYRPWSFSLLTLPFHSERPPAFPLGSSICPDLQSR